mmetsp:Transcript_41927/g.70871  ORF Transcript_41927/g.70871 Transcript_41927/m.70871 type:complete len:81 (-) Transcript_41927:316-558(-)
MFYVTGPGQGQKILMKERNKAAEHCVCFTTEAKWKGCMPSLENVQKQEQKMRRHQIHIPCVAGKEHLKPWQRNHVKRYGH